MQYVNLGKTGLKVSKLCLGCMTYGDHSWREWILTEDQSRPFLKQAMDAGINFYDTANVYSYGASETVLGNFFHDQGIKRDDVVIATKVYSEMGPGPNQRGLSRKAIFQELDASLRRLRTDFVDLYQTHRWDPATPIEETMDALDDCVRSGKVRYLGASSMYAWQFAKAQAVAQQNGWARFVSMQNHYNLIYREEEREMMPLCADQGVGVIPWSPLARGFLAGNRHKGGGGETTRSKSDPFGAKIYYRDDDFAVVDRLTEVAKQLGKPNMQVALAWMMTKPFVTAPIIGASKPHHLDDAVAALEITLSPEDVRRLEEPYQPHPILGHD
jgi:aryl-alcohol dehydrogenase-like predicted oxidoreductase